MRVALSALIVVLVACVTAEDQARSYDYFQAPYYAGEADPKNLRPTTTVTSTSVSTVTCTKSTTICSGGRRRRAVLFDGDNEEQFPIAPSAVEGVEATPLTVRDSRAADPQYLVMVPSFQPYSGSPFPFPSQYRPVQPYYAAYPQQAGERLFWSLSTLLTVTKTSTVFSIFTSTSTPACSAAGAIPQCPNN